MNFFETIAAIFNRRRMRVRDLSRKEDALRNRIRRQNAVRFSTSQMNPVFSGVDPRLCRQNAMRFTLTVGA